MLKRMLLIGLMVFSISSIAIGIELKFNTQDFPPFNYEVNGVVSGPAADIIRAVCERINATCSFKLMVWKEAQQEVKDGKANAMFVIGWNRGRSEWLYFSPQILQTEYGFFVPNGDTLSFRNIRDLSGYKVGVYGPSNTSRSLQSIQEKMEKDKTMTPITIDVRTDDIIVFKDLDSPRRTLMAAYSNRDVGNSIIRKENLRNLRYAGADRKLNYFIGFSKEYTTKQTVDRFNVAFIKLYIEGKIAVILKRYAMVPADIEPGIIAYYSNLKP